MKLKYIENMYKYGPKNSHHKLVHKRMSILTFEGLSTTFEASTNVYFCHISSKYTVKR